MLSQATSTPQPPPLDANMLPNIDLSDDKELLLIAAMVFSYSTNSKSTEYQIYMYYNTWARKALRKAFPKAKKNIHVAPQYPVSIEQIDDSSDDERMLSIWKFPDFMGFFCDADHWNPSLYDVFTADPEGISMLLTRGWNPTIMSALCIVEIKRGVVVELVHDILRRTKRWEACLDIFNKYYIEGFGEAAAQIMDQVRYFFKGHPTRKSIVAIAGVGDRWCWRSFSREDADVLRLSDYTDSNYALSPKRTQASAVVQTTAGDLPQGHKRGRSSINSQESTSSQECQPRPGWRPRERKRRMIHTPQSSDDPLLTSLPDPENIPQVVSDGEKPLQQYEAFFNVSCESPDGFSRVTPMFSAEGQVELNKAMRAVFYSQPPNIRKALLGN